MLTVAAWSIFALGVAHVLFGLRKFRQPLAAAFNDGLLGKFTVNDTRRLAFWFMMFGPLLALAGHIALHAAHSADLGLLKIVGSYLLCISIVGVLALPRSPFWIVLPIAPFLIAGGYGWLS